MVASLRVCEANARRSGVVFKEGRRVKQIVELRSEQSFLRPDRAALRREQEVVEDTRRRSLKESVDAGRPGGRVRLGDQQFDW
jgi:hypothetical protein